MPSRVCAVTWKMVDSTTSMDSGFLFDELEGYGILVRLRRSMTDPCWTVRGDRVNDDVK